jgi:prephenate dehydrogenase
LHSQFKKIVVIGVGLIGGSFAKAVKQRGLAEEVCGFGRDAQKLQWGVDHQILDTFSVDIELAMKNCELVFLAVPLGSMEPMLKIIGPHLPEQCIVTDGGSAKQSFVNSSLKCLQNHLPYVLPAHPIAGKEVSGIEASDGDLYVDHRLILTPLEQTHEEVITKVTQLWQSLGAIVEKMRSDFHDEVFAATSHLPHFLAFNLVDLLNEHPELGDVFKYTAGGFRDFTRIASSDPVMWRDIGVYNSEAIAKWLRQYQASIANLADLVENQDAEALEKLFSRAKSARDKHIIKS